MFPEGSIYVKVKSLISMIHWMVSSINYTTLLLHIKNLQYLEHIENEWWTDHLLMMRNVKFGRYVTLLWTIFIQGDVLGFLFVTVLNTVEVRVRNKTRTSHMLPRAVHRKLQRTKSCSHCNFGPLLLLTLVQLAFSVPQLFCLLTHVVSAVHDMNSLKKKKKTDGFKEMEIIERFLKTQTRYLLCSLFERGHCD